MTCHAWGLATVSSGSYFAPNTSQGRFCPSRHGRTRTDPVVVLVLNPEIWLNLMGLKKFSFFNSMSLIRNWNYNKVHMNVHVVQCCLAPPNHIDIISHSSCFSVDRWFGGGGGRGSRSRIPSSGSICVSRSSSNSNTNKSNSSNSSSSRSRSRSRSGS